MGATKFIAMNPRRSELLGNRAAGAHLASHNPPCVQQQEGVVHSSSFHPDKSRVPSPMSGGSVLDFLCVLEW